MLRWPEKPWVVAISILWAVGGCVSHKPNDLSLVSVTQESGTHESRQAPEFLTVTFTTHTNLALFFGDGELTLGVTDFFCDMSGRYVALLDYRGVYVDGKDLLHWRSEQFRSPATPPFRYQVRLIVTRPEIPYVNPAIPAIDLRRDPRDVCFYLHGGNMSYWHRFRSNTLVVPKAVIEAALQVPSQLSPSP